MIKNIENLTTDSGIYMITNLINGNSYIGQAVNIKKRFYSHHICDYKNENNSQYNCQLYQAFRKYGLENFSVIILEKCLVSELDNKEIEYIRRYDTFKNGYNMTEGGQYWSPNIHSEETERKRKETLAKTQALMAQNHPRAKLTNEEVINIRQRYIDGEDMETIYKDYINKYNNKETFKRIILGYTYKSVGNIPNKEQIRHTNAKLTAEQVKEMRTAYKKEKISFDKLGKRYGISGTTCKNIIRRITYKHVD